MVDSFAVTKINTINKLLKVFTCIGFTKSPMTNLKLVVLQHYYVPVSHQHILEHILELEPQ
jgi:hypothetical protein